METINQNVKNVKNVKNDYEYELDKNKFIEICNGIQFDKIKFEQIYKRKCNKIFNLKYLDEHKVKFFSKI